MPDFLGEEPGHEDGGGTTESVGRTGGGRMMVGLRGGVDGGNEGDAAGPKEIGGGR